MKNFLAHNKKRSLKNGARTVKKLILNDWKLIQLLNFREK